MAELYREDLLERLRRLDEDANLLFGQKERLQVVIVGGGSLVLLRYSERATREYLKTKKCTKSGYKAREKWYNRGRRKR